MWLLPSFCNTLSFTGAMLHTSSVITYTLITPLSPCNSHSLESTACFHDRKKKINPPVLQENSEPCMTSSFIRLFIHHFLECSTQGHKYFYPIWIQTFLSNTRTLQVIPKVNDFHLCRTACILGDVTMAQWSTAVKCNPWGRLSPPTIVNSKGK